jgi:hypothetical protein
MSNLSEQQFAKYSAIEVPHDVHEYEYRPLPASMERHAPGEYQPTLPGMEHMLKGEQTHTSVFFKHQGKEEDEEVAGSDWRPREKTGEHVTVDPRSLSSHPAQDWVSDKELHAPHQRSGAEYDYRESGRRPRLENIGGERVIQDGHHRVARSILNGAQQIAAKEWKA